MANKKQFDYEMALGDLINDEIQLKLVLECLEDLDAEDAQITKQKTTGGSKFGELDKNRTNIQDLVTREEYNFKEELDYEGGKKYRNMKPYEQPKFRLLGYSQQGKPLFKISDLFLSSDPKLRLIIDKYFNDIIHGSSKNVALETGELSRKYEKGYDFGKIIENWEKKQYEYFTNNKKNQMDQKQLQEIVVNRGDSKDNYWVYKVGEKKKYDYQDIFEHKNYKESDMIDCQFYNHNLLNPNFIENMHKAADRIRLQYSQIEQFESDEEEMTKNQKQVTQSKWIDQMNANSNNKSETQLQTPVVKLWGEVQTKQLAKDEVYSRNKPVKTILVEGQIKQIVSADLNKKDSKPTINMEPEKEDNETFVDEIIKRFSTINYEIVNNKYKGKETLNQYNRIEFHLENPNFFLTKLHYALQKRSEQFSNFVQGTNKAALDTGGINRNISAQSTFGIDHSLISGSRTGNQQTIRASQLEGTGNLAGDDDDHQTIENKILREMSLQSKKPINHSDIATKLHFIKFSNELDYFKNFHRYEFKYDVFFAKKTKIKLLRHPKPLKCKGTDFNINIEKKDSYTKFSKPQSISLASEDIKEFIMIEYIEQNPLLMSDVGMCQRMILQVNNKEMLHKINRDIIENMEIDAYEEMRDNPSTNKEVSNTSTEQKMELWRKNIKNYFGENGKVYLWQPKRESKLIGNPEGLGVALMESNLAAMPLVKKTPNKRDFLLVRENDKWVIRKIDSIYVSGQVQPKQVVFSPGDRPYQTFLQKYQVDFLTKVALNSPNYKITIEAIKNHFPNTPQTSAESRIRKILKQKMNSETKDNKTYQIKINEDQQIKFKLDPQEFCLYQRMQKSLCELEESGIHHMKNMEKMKSILRKYFRKNKNQDLQHFATARMIRDQLQLTSWYLTESFRKFIDKNARIEMVGHADPTNGHGGYSFIKKPQKQRTDKDEAQQKQEKNKLSGTQFDLRKLKAEDSIGLLEQLGYTRQTLTNYTRWELVNLLKSQKDTQYSRKQRESKELKEQNQRKQRSKALNTLLKYLRNEEEGLIEPFQYNYDKYLRLDYYCQREIANWKNAKQKLEQSLRIGEQNDEGEDDGEDED